jgi:hypothetical protein
VRARRARGVVPFVAGDDVDDDDDDDELIKA